ncbi:MAG: cyclic nucleotide-binding domain-containing protein [Myxococcales bacterium]
MSAELQQLKSFLVGTPFFGGLADAALDQLVGRLRRSTVKAGQAIFHEGDTGRSMYIVESGEVLMCRKGGSGNEVHLVRLGPGNFFGETTLIEMQPRPWTARAERDTALLELSNVDLYNLYREDVKAYVLVLQNINRELCRRIRRADLRITEIADESGDEQTQIRVLPRR